MLVNFLVGNTLFSRLIIQKRQSVNFWGNIFSEIERNNLSIREQLIIERYTSQMIDNHLCEILVPLR